MPDIPEIVKAHVLRNCGRLPETQEEIDEYLDLINNAKEYETAIILESKFSKKYLKKMGIKSSVQIKEEGEKLFSHHRTPKVNKTTNNE